MTRHHPLSLLSHCHLLTGAWLLLAPALAVGEPSQAPPTATDARQAFALNLEELDWKQDRRFPGLQSALLWADPKTGQQGMLRRFPAGFAPPQHSHPESERIVLLSGTITVRYPNLPEKTLHPGAYSEIPPHTPHQAQCAPTNDCLFVLISSGAYEMREAAPTSAGSAR